VLASRLDDRELTPLLGQEVADCQASLTGSDNDDLEL
jgi:hypothetical protein